MLCMESLELSGDDYETLAAFATHVIFNLVAISTAINGSLVEGDDRPLFQDGLQLLLVLQAFGFGQFAAHWREGLAVGEDEDGPDGQGYMLVGVLECDESGVVGE